MPVEPSDLPDGLIIPVDVPSIEDFKRQFEAAVSDESCHFYIDTSILIWATQIGKAARAQLTKWIEAVGQSRFHVPVWAAHEFFNHHVNDLIGRKLSEAADAMRKTADQTYSEIRPFLGEALDERSPEDLHLQARDTLVQLKRLAADVGRWKEKHYQQHLQEVVDLISSLRLRHRPGILGFMSDIDVLERNRYAGRIPPGFKDRNKREKKLDMDRAGSSAEFFGSNRYGDLMFWREVIEHASSSTAVTGIVIISNDAKNDWQMGGGRSPDEDQEMRELRKGWPPIPTVHPMLRYEANYAAAVNTVMLIDCEYLALLLRKTGVEANEFVGAAISTRLPDPRSDAKEKRKSKVREALAASGSAASVLESDQVVTSSFALVRASRQKQVTGATKTLLADMFDDQTSEQPFSLPDVFLSNATTADLVQLGRGVHERATNGEALAVTRLTDLIAGLPDLPVGSATCLHFGVLISIYFDEENGVRLPPVALALDELMRFRRDDFAARSLEALEFRFKNELKRSPFVVGRSKDVLDLTLRTKDVASSELHTITSLQVDGIELLTLAQSDETLRLNVLLENKTPVSLQELTDIVARSFGIPSSLIELGDRADRILSYDALTGIESPNAVFITKEDSGA
ncbi:MAG: hypothetical protein QOI12_4016 [Alphaproteobacteria bacterium]|nr:hypothetical protein [Alphaproteobacteria bacterium]